ncbi:glucokinase [Marinibactrum halimedae]|uniref:Glucokinase n=1 Tax=Marinibactrum halimedae TaxID=1444977 RepID=A0AA37WKA8_9GAMM|nr:glucokinase [Marinibactrum halimedae]MCD9459136.1 glucokinase [Marinibactrum halimedae]GLS24738.1 hypothetical protein GCM10007877_04520 [Marinibactrum halimedae]
MGHQHSEEQGFDRPPFKSSYVTKSYHETTPFVVADVGGTNARFGLLKPDGTGRPFSYDVSDIKTLPCEHYGSFQDCFLDYLSTVTAVRPRAGAIALAGPVIGDEFSMTNRGWRFSLSGLAAEVGLERVEAMNDFAAQAYSILTLKKDQHTQIVEGAAAENAPKVVLGPGTGLGVAGLTHLNDKWNVLPGEGGHLRAAPVSPLAAEVIEYLTSRYQYVSYERLLSGPGLVNIYQALLAIEGNTGRDITTAAQVSQNAANGESALAMKAVRLFSETLASFAGDVAMLMGARAGVYIGGGIFPKLLPQIAISEFTSAFRSKGPMSHYLENIPVEVITGEYLALHGAGAWLEQCLQ